MAIKTAFATKQTTDATPSNLWTSPSAFQGGMWAIVHAEHGATGDQQVFRVYAGRSDTDNSVVSNVEQAGDAGGQTWAVEVAEGTDAMEINITGEVSHTITWVAEISYFST